MGYISLKTRYLEQQARNFPSLNRKDTGQEGSTMEENQDTDEPIMPSNPIEEKDMKIALLETEIEKAKAKHVAKLS